MALNQEELNRFRIQRERLSSMLSESSEVVSELNMSSASENLGKLSDKVNNDTFKIQVIGTFSNGKSTVINAFLAYLPKIKPYSSTTWPILLAVLRKMYLES